MDWLAFMEKKRTELVNTGHIMDNEMFITHLLNSLPQAEYEGAILSIKEKLRRRTCGLAEIEQLLDDKYQSMKYVKGWEEEEDDYALFASPAKKNNAIRHFSMLQEKKVGSWLRYYNNDDLSNQIRCFCKESKIYKPIFFKPRPSNALR